MSEIKTYPAPAEFAAQANVTAAQYDEMYRQSVEDPDGFWSEQAENYISWFKPWNSVSDWSFAEDDLHIKWFEGAELNVSYNAWIATSRDVPIRSLSFGRVTILAKIAKSPMRNCTGKYANSPMC